MPSTYDSDKMGQHRWQVQIWEDDGDDPFFKALREEECRTKALAEQQAQAWVARHRERTANRVWAELRGGERLTRETHPSLFASIDALLLGIAGREEWEQATPVWALEDGVE